MTPIIFCLNDTCEIAKSVAREIGLEYSLPRRIIFSDGEMLLNSEITVRQKTTIVVCSLSKDTNSRLVELLIFIDSLKRAAAAEIVVVLTYYGYARQDRKERGRYPITAKLVAKLIQVAGATSIITVDLHNPSIQGFFDISIDDIRAQYILAEKILDKSEDFSVVSPDHGGATRARLLAELLQMPDIAIIDKRRVGPNQCEIFGVLGDVKGRDVVILDDIIDTGGTIIQAAKVLRENGAQKIIVAATHGVFSKGFDLFEEEPTIEEVIVTNTINQDEFKRYSKHTCVDISHLISQILVRQLSASSVSELYSILWDNLSQKGRKN